MTALREKFDQWVKTVAPDRRCFFVDEAGSFIGMRRRFGRAPDGQRVHIRQPRNRGTCLTMIGALSANGLEAMMTIRGGTTGDVFAAWTAEFLAPLLQPGDLVVLDNLAAHRDARVRQTVESAGAKLIFTPPYSPEFNPIELAWNKVKAFLRQAGADSENALNAAIAAAMDTVTPNDARAWRERSGWPSQPAREP